MQDRIKQMAVEAGFSLHSFNAIDGDEVMAGEYVITDDLARFARLVAEDCARVCDEQGDEWESDAQVTHKNYARFSGQAIRARYAETKEG